METLETATSWTEIEALIRLSVAPRVITPFAYPGVYMFFVNDVHVLDFKFEAARGAQGSTGFGAQGALGWPQSLQAIPTTGGLKHVLASPVGQIVSFMHPRGVITCSLYFADFLGRGSVRTDPDAHDRARTVLSTWVSAHVF
jgi:hypothetical protein